MGYRGLDYVWPTRAEVAEVWRLNVEEGLGGVGINRRTGMPVARASNLISDLKSGRMRWDPVDDEVAVERALRDPEEHLDSLTRFERERVIAEYYAMHGLIPSSRGRESGFRHGVKAKERAHVAAVRSAP